MGKALALALAFALALALALAARAIPLSGLLSSRSVSNIIAHMEGLSIKEAVKL